MDVPQATPGHSLRASIALKQLVGTSGTFSLEISKISVVAPTNVPVLIVGETGTGKELCARAIHYLSKRSGGPFVPVNCGAMPTDLVENEIFGHEIGAYTGANSRRAGMIEEAEGGTIFLDEIDSLLPVAQSKILRFLQEGEVRRLGGVKTFKPDVRVVAALNCDVGDALRSQCLREDLYYRLSVVQLTLPPLRDRREDIPLLAKHFVAKWNPIFGKNVLEISPGATERLIAHDWPGNVRELENTVARAVLFSESEVIESSQVSLLNVGDKTKGQDAQSNDSNHNEKNNLECLLKTHNGNISHAAHATGKNRRTIQRLIQKYEIDLHEFHHH